MALTAKHHSSRRNRQPEGEVGVARLNFSGNSLETRQARGVISLETEWAPPDTDTLQSLLCYTAQDELARGRTRVNTGYLT